jgi:hypothetical protein
MLPGASGPQSLLVSSIAFWFGADNIEKVPQKVRTFSIWASSDEVKEKCNSQ